MERKFCALVTRRGVSEKSLGVSTLQVYVVSYCQKHQFKEKCETECSLSDVLQFLQLKHYIEEHRKCEYKIVYYFRWLISSTSKIMNVKIETSCLSACFQAFTWTFLTRDVKKENKQLNVSLGPQNIVMTTWELFKKRNNRRNFFDVEK